MMEYLVAIGFLVLLSVCWGAFQLWIGRQADGTPTNSDERSCHGCGGVSSSSGRTAKKKVSVPIRERNDNSGRRNANGQ